LRAVIRSVLDATYDRDLTFQHDSRAFRNRLIVTSLLVVTAAGVLVLLQWRLPGGGLLDRPSAAADVPRWALMLVVITFGAVGGLLVSIPALAAIPRAPSPYNFPLQQAILKVTAGALTGLVGVIVIGSSGVTNGFSSLEALVGTAVVFGASQQAVTQFLDKRAQQIIDSAPST
jgi:hypothetical protein